MRTQRHTSLVVASLVVSRSRQPPLVVYPLNDVSLDPGGGMPRTSPPLTHTMHDEVLTSVTSVDVALAELLAGQFAISLHSSTDDMGTSLAWGEIVGTVRLHQHCDAPPTLVIPLRELNDSGYAGMAWLNPTGDNQTEFTLFVAADLFGPFPNWQAGDSSTMEPSLMG